MVSIGKFSYVHVDEFSNANHDYLIKVSRNDHGKI